jgi:hypothetical protein
VSNLHVRAVTATDRSKTGEFQFDHRSLGQLAREAEGKPIYYDFLPERRVGRVVAASTRKVEILPAKSECPDDGVEDELAFTIIEARLDFYDPNGNDWYIAPQIIIKGEDWELVGFGLTQTPAGQYLSPVEVLGR